MYFGGTVVWMDSPTYYIMWNGSATFNVYLNGKEVDVFTRYNITSVGEAEVAAEEWMTEDDPDYYNF
jgi:hypothetical protein